VDGVLETTPKVFVRSLARGSYLSRSDVDTGRRVAVLGSAVAVALFGERDPVGTQITIAGVRFRVVGVFAPLGQSLGVNRDQEVHIPITTAQRVFETDRVDGMAVKAPDRATLTRSSKRIVAMLRQRHPTVSSARSPRRSSAYPAYPPCSGSGRHRWDQYSSVGVSNIILVSVGTDQEIGLEGGRARPRDIRRQFLFERFLTTIEAGSGSCPAPPR
jgi:putative ABC transport system permease protein